VSAYLLTRGSYSDYGVIGLVSRDKPIMDKEWGEALRRADEEFWEAHRAATRAFCDRTDRNKQQWGLEFSAAWMASPEYAALNLNDRFARAVQLLGATIIEYTEVWCDI
jgi:hypothetical protein